MKIDKDDPVKQEAYKLMKDVQRGPGQAFMSDAKFDELFEEGKRWVKQCMDDDGDFNMTIFIYGRGYNPKKDDWTLMPVMFADWPPPDTIGGRDGKQVTLMGIGATFAEKFPDHMPMCVVQMSEAWMAELGPDHAEEDETLAPSKHSNRIECAIVAAVAFDQRESFSMRKIQRTKAGKYKGLIEYKETKYDPKSTSTEEYENNITKYIFMGYLMAREKGGKSGNKTTT